MLPVSKGRDIAGYKMAAGREMIREGADAASATESLNHSDGLATPLRLRMER